MELLKAICERRSVRAFQEKPVPAAVLARLKEAWACAPSAGNLHARRLFLVPSLRLRKALARAALGQAFVAQAPAVAVACADTRASEKEYGARGRELYSVCDAACALQNLLLQAHAEGLGACWVGALSEEEVTRLLGLPSRLRPIALAPLGYPAERPPPPPRPPLSALAKDLG